jgi:hypothetical protein
MNFVDKNTAIYRRNGYGSHSEKFESKELMPLNLTFHHTVTTFTPYFAQAPYCYVPMPKRRPNYAFINAPTSIRIQILDLGQEWDSIVRE